REFAEAIKAEFPDQMLAYNCSPSFNWKANLDDETIAKFQRELASMGYTFQFITLAGFHSLNYSMFNLAKGYHERQMSAFVELQQAEFAAEKDGFTATRHQREAGTSYFDLISTTVNPESATTALADSTEAQQFQSEPLGKIRSTRHGITNYPTHNVRRHRGDRVRGTGCTATRNSHRRSLGIPGLPTHQAECEA